MNVICRDDKLSIRSLEDTDEDMNILLGWFNNPNVTDYYGESKTYTLDEIKSKYSKRISDGLISSCIFEYDNHPIGYIQYYEIDNEEYEIDKETFLKIVNENDKAIGLDLFIGDDEFRDKGFGSKVLKLLIDKIFEDENIKCILIDPSSENLRAISCYKKLGFYEVIKIPNREIRNGLSHDSIIMKIDNYNLK